MEIENVDKTEWKRALPDTGFEVFHTAEAPEVIDKHSAGDLKWLAEQLRLGNPAAPFQVLWASLVANVTFVSVTDPLPTFGTLRQMVELSAKTAIDRLVAGESGRTRGDTDPHGETSR